MQGSGTEHYNPSPCTDVKSKVRPPCTLFPRPIECLEELVQHKGDGDEEREGEGEGKMDSQVPTIHPHHYSWPHAVIGL